MAYKYNPFTGELDIIDTTDEKVKADASDEVEGFLSDKVDNVTIEVDTGSHHLKVVDDVFADKSHTHLKNDITDFDHTHLKADIIDFSHTHVKAEITDFAHTHSLADINIDIDKDWNAQNIVNLNSLTIGGTSPATEKLEVIGAIRIGNTTNTNSGTIRWTGTDFEGYDGTAWVSFTAGGAGGATTFVDLTDTPSTITANKKVIGSPDGTSLIFSEEDDHSTFSPSDILTWEKRILVPLSGKEKIVKYPNNPIIPVGPAGTYDGDTVGQPSVVIVDDVIYVYYAAINKTYADYRRDTIAVATAPLSDIESTNYTKYSGNPILTADATGWENVTGSLGLVSPVVMYDPTATNVGTDTKFKMWYAGGAGVVGGSGIGYAYSTDGYTWTKYSGNPILANSFGDTLNRYPALDVIRIGDLFFMLYRNAVANLSLAYSEDKGITWTNLGECLQTGAAGEWDDNTLGFGHLYHASGVLYLGYAGQSSADSKQRGGFATLSLSDLASGSYSFKKFFRNPVMSENNPNSTGVIDDGHNYGTGAIIQYKDTFYFYIDIQGTTVPRQIGLAYIKR